MRLIISIFLILFSGFEILSQNPVSDFDVNIDYKCGYAEIEFTNNSLNADTFLWDHNGNGEFIEIFEPRDITTHSDYSWRATLIAKGNGLSDTLSKDITIQQTRPGFNYYIPDTNQYAPLEVHFSVQSYVRSEDTLTYYWEFGDGTQSNLENPIKIFTKPATYWVFLHGIKNDGCELIASNTITVKDTSQRGEYEFITSKCLPTQ